GVLHGEVAATGYVDDAVRIAVWEGGGEHMNDAVAAIDCVDQPHAVAGAGGVRLPARRGVEGGAVEDNPVRVASVGNDGGVELQGVGVVVDPVGHPPNLPRGRFTRE